MSEQKRQFFGTDGIRAKANAFPLLPDFVVQLGQSAADAFLARRTDTRNWPIVIIGKDTRQSCDMLESAIAAGLTSRGIDVRLAGVVPTPAVAMLTKETGALFGVVISASHNPFDDNGIKFFCADGYKLDDALESEIERGILHPPPPPEGGPVGRISPLEGAAERYIDFVCRSVGEDRHILGGLRIALDAANGAGHHTSEAILRALGATVLPMHHHPSGININLDCGCTHPAVIESLVKQTGAHVGVSHDGDADRVLLCDETGSALDGDEFMAIAALSMIESGTLADNTLVATVMSNAGLVEAIEAAGGRVIRAGVGDRYVVEQMRAGNYNFGGEQSGHFIFRDFNSTGDGIIAAVQLLAILKKSGKPLGELRRVMSKFPQAQRNIRVSRKPAREELAATARLAEVEKTLGSAGRVLLRYSGTEPLLRLLIEGRDADYIHREADLIAEQIRAEIGA
ncbi:MAG: phosphoglucosamine mutase [Verrucomicrobiaceae bacterium]|nr:phosphoglucosamine mutase [Verrucomicrobiaceae bacterium]